jgi:signal recognition particle receptor subunit beta
VQLNFAAREVAIKLVYYGPALSGKTTNLKSLHDLVSDQSRGRLMTLETRDDRTLFFDMLPLVVRGEGGMALRIKVFTVPGQVLHGSTRRLVLQGADGIAFIADSQQAETHANAESFLDLRDNLRELGRSIRDVPVIIQFNKRDLPGIRPDSEIEALAKKGREPVYTACAISGAGVLESFYGLLYLVYGHLDREHQLSQKIGMDRAQFLKSVVDRLGIQRRPEELLGAAVGGTIAGGAQ